MMRAWAFGLIAVAAGAVLAVGGWLALRPGSGAPATGPDRAPPPPPASAVAAEAPLPPGVVIRFVDVTRSAGLDFRHFDGRTDMQYIMDQTGSGLGWLDYD